MAEGGEDFKTNDMETSRYISKEYHKSFFKTIYELRLENEFCDVKLQVENKQFSCHKIVLMAGSPYFHAMFISNMCEHDKDIVNIGGVSPETFAILLDFLYTVVGDLVIVVHRMKYKSILHERQLFLSITNIGGVSPEPFPILLDFKYTGEVDVSDENCEELLTAADMFSISEVVTACCKFLKERLLPENCTGIYLFAEAIACHILKKEAETFIFKQFLKVCNEDEFLNVSKETLIHFLNSECLHVENEYQVFKAAMNWILYKVQERRKHIFDVMTPIRFPIIPETQMDKYVTYVGDTDLSIQVALKKILSDFRTDKKLPGLFDRRFKSTSIKHHLLVPRQCARKSIYVCGGFTRPKGGRWSDAKTLNTAEKYDTFYNTWHSCPSLQFHRSALGAGVVNGQVCVVGGENDMLILDSVETYDPETYEWKSLPGLISPRCGLGVCTIDNCLYAVGGWIGSEIGSTIEKYDPESQKWSIVGHCRKLKCWMGVTADKGLLYMVGGCNDLSEELTAVESFNPVTKEWTSLADLNVKRSYTAVAILDDCLYAVGGWNETDGALKSVEKLSFHKGYWVEVAPLSTGRAGAMVVVVNNMLYVIGGRNYTDEFTAPSTLDTVECYDPTTDMWTESSSMLTSRCEGSAVVI